MRMHVEDTLAMRGSVRRLKIMMVFVRRLLAKGADVNAQGGHFGTALQAAWQRGHDGIFIIFNLLLEHRADGFLVDKIRLV